jgi:hypothetical protein
MKTLIERMKKRCHGDKFWERQPFLSALPKDLWNHVFAFLGKNDLNQLALTSKSIYFFLHFNVPSAWTSATFNGLKKISPTSMNDKIIRALALPRFSQITELHFIGCECPLLSFLQRVFLLTPPPLFFLFSFFRFNIEQANLFNSSSAMF